MEDSHDPIANCAEALNSALLCEETYGSGDVGETWGFMSLLNEEAYGDNDLPVGGGKPRFLAINLGNSPTQLPAPSPIQLPAPGPSTVKDTSVEDSLRAWRNSEDIKVVYDLGPLPPGVDESSFSRPRSGFLKPGSESNF